MIEMTIDSIRVSLMNYQRVVMLKEKIAERYTISLTDIDDTFHDIKLPAHRLKN